MPEISHNCSCLDIIIHLFKMVQNFIDFMLVPTNDTDIES